METPETIEGNVMDGLDLENVDMELGSDCLTSESLGLERYRAVAIYQKLSYDEKANKGVGNNQQVDAISKQMAALRVKVALIDRDCPAAKNVQKRLMRQEEITARANKD